MILFREADAATVPAVGETHLHVADDLAALPDLLTDAERARAAKFRLPRVQEQFVATRGRLRTLLGQTLGIEPIRVPLLIAEGGKPHLPDEFGLHFNVSHTEGLAVFAFSRSRVGVDVEKRRPIPGVEELVRRFFAAAECEEFLGLPVESRELSFLRAWTRKEAVLKAVGRGVPSLECCEVGFGETPAVRRLDADTDLAGKWELHGWQPRPGYEACVAVEATA